MYGNFHVVPMYRSPALAVAWEVEGWVARIHRQWYTFVFFPFWLQVEGVLKPDVLIPHTHTPYTCCVEHMNLGAVHTFRYGSSLCSAFLVVVPVLDRAPVPGTSPALRPNDPPQDFWPARIQMILRVLIRYLHTGFPFTGRQRMGPGLMLSWKTAGGVLIPTMVTIGT